MSKSKDELRPILNKMKQERDIKDKLEERICCSGMRSLLEKGWVTFQKVEPQVDTGRYYFMIKLEGSDTRTILQYCFICGHSIYPRTRKD